MLDRFWIVRHPTGFEEDCTSLLALVKNVEPGSGGSLSIGNDFLDSDLALARLDDAGTVGSNQTGLVLRLHDRFDLDHIESGDTFSDADDEVHLGLDGFQNGVSSERRGHIDDGSFGISGGLGLGHGTEDGET